ncbi:dihydrodipicolinate synthase family protein [Brevibacterium sp. 50QC2O2]|jgi:4-hydroxy-tetrahydrodipicolinate synthase|uniref:dihydrodipicolinate synthase family protein n=1 Tax=Brevibacterium TaxID=1696 RepID=UPI00211C16BE|nr:MULTISPECIES: dihydrodipicolinate synthase family protein [unclassified Brevibacterium]MCQ9385714.1 dihydrodipicolinate synthase family protein [Brevibacterium sp. 68QC2CO]MCQ9389859.1 dihydrodipicolinate synthase family protein [Brevibacterium sp. 50QC2O2]
MDHNRLFTGLSAFPLTPLRHDRIDEAAFIRIIGRLAAARVDSIGALGSTGSYAYLDRAERARVARLAVEHAGDTPVIVGIGALRTSQVQALAHDAQAAGAAAVLLAPMTYQALSPDEVYGLYAAVTGELDVPLVVYDNPGTTHFTFPTELYGRIAELPHIGALKIPPVRGDAATVAAHLAEVRAQLPGHVRLGTSGDSAAARALMAGCDLWFSVIGGVLPELTLELTRASLAGDTDSAERAQALLQPVWDLMDVHGSLRVAAALAQALELTGSDALPAPVAGLSGLAARAAEEFVAGLGDLGRV